MILRIIGLLAVLVLAACGSQTTTAPTSIPATIAPIAEEEAAALPTDANGDALVAIVNGHAITLTEYERELTRRTQAGSPATAGLQSAVLNTLVEQTLIEQAAAAQQLVVSDSEIQGEIQSNIQAAGSEAAWQNWLNTNMYTADEYNDLVRSALVTAQVRDAVTGDMPDTVLQVHARHILVETETQANEVLNRLNQGEDFGALAAELSRDVTTQNQGGDLGWFAQGELLEQTLADAAFRLEAGQMVGPIATRLGYHILQTLEKAERPVTPDMQASLAQIEFENWLQTQFQNAQIELYLQ